MEAGPDMRNNPVRHQLSNTVAVLSKFSLFLLLLKTDSRIILHFLQTIPLGKMHKERKINESNRHRPPGGRFGQNRHPEGNQKNP